MTQQPTTQWKDVAHLYLGCNGITKTIMEFSTKLVAYNPFSDLREGVCLASMEQLQFKPVLRLLNSMTWEEAKEYFNMPGAELIEIQRREYAVVFDYRWKDGRGEDFNNEDGFSYSGVAISEDNKFTPEQVAWLLSKGFDLFGLIESGQAIDATTTNQKEPIIQK